MKIFIIIYLAFFILWSGIGVYEDIRSKFSPAIIIADISVSVLACIGIVLFYLNIQPPGLAYIAKLILILIIGWESYIGRLDYLDMVRNPDPELSQSENRWGNRLGILICLIFYLPCLLMICQLAF